MKKLIPCALALLVLTACSSDSSDDATLTPTPTNNVTLGAPTAASPLTDEQWGWLEQPLTLTVNNAAVTGTATIPITYEFEVASDDAFTHIIFGQKGVAQGAGRTVSGGVPVIQFPGILFWRARATSGTVNSPFSPIVRFELEGQGGHISPIGYDDGQGNPQSEQYALDIIHGTGAEHPHTLAVFGSEREAELAAEELLLRIIWHLKLAGFDAARQRNPSGAISKDKMNIFIRGTWRTYDIFTLGYEGVATRIGGLQHTPPEDPQFNDGIPD